MDNEITDEELDYAVNQVLQEMPAAGNVMVAGALRAIEIHPKLKRLRMSLNRVDPTRHLNNNAPAVLRRIPYHVSTVLLLTGGNHPVPQSYMSLPSFLCLPEHLIINVSICGNRSLAPMPYGTSTEITNSFTMALSYMAALMGILSV